MTVFEDAHSCLRMARGRQKGVLLNSTAPPHEKQPGEHRRAKGHPAAQRLLFPSRRNRKSFSLHKQNYTLNSGQYVGSGRSVKSIEALLKLQWDECFSICKHSASTEFRYLIGDAQNLGSRSVLLPLFPLRDHEDDMHNSDVFLVSSDALLFSQ